MSVPIRPNEGSSFPRVSGGAVWGRLGGLISGVVNAVVDWFTGKDVGDHVYSAFFGTPSKSDDSGLVQSTYSAPQSAQVPAHFAKVNSTPAVGLSSFGAFNDDGGFAPELTAKEVATTKEDFLLRPFVMAAVSSYTENGRLDERQEPFRFRFPA